MKPHLSLLTLGVRDLGAAGEFYVDGLGWEPKLHVPGEVVFIQVGHGLLLSLRGVEDLAAESGELYRGPLSPPISLGYLVETEAAVAETLDQAVAAGGTLVVPARRRDWGGVSGYFADPDGYRWEVAHNPGFTVEDEGEVTISATAS